MSIFHTVRETMIRSKFGSSPSGTRLKMVSEAGDKITVEFGGKSPELTTESLLKTGGELGYRMDVSVALPLGGALVIGTADDDTFIGTKNGGKGDTETLGMFLRGGETPTTPTPKVK